MKPDVWMPIYIADYMADTAHLIAPQHGAYLLLMMAYWRRGGPLPDDDSVLAAIARVSLSGALSDWKTMRLAIAEFFEIKDGLWIHHQLNAELLAAKQRKEAKIAAAKATNDKRNAKRGDKATLSDTLSVALSDSLSGYSSSVPSAGEREYARERGNAAKNADRPSLDEVLAFASSPHCGVAEWKARDWFNEMEGCGWLDYDHRPIAKWQPVLLRVKAKWEADGRPTGPPKSQHAGTANGTPEWVQIKSLEALIADCTKKLAGIHVPDHRLYPNEYKAACDKRNPIVEERHNLHVQLTAIQRKQITTSTTL